MHCSCAVLHPQHDHAQRALQVLQLGWLLGPLRLLGKDIAAQRSQAHLQMTGMFCLGAMGATLTGMMHAPTHAQQHMDYIGMQKLCEPACSTVPEQTSPVKVQQLCVAC